MSVLLIVIPMDRAKGLSNNPPLWWAPGRAQSQEVLQSSGESSGRRQRLCSRLPSEIRSRFGAKRHLNLWPAAMTLHSVEMLQPLISLRTLKAKLQPVNLAQVGNMRKLLFEFFFQFRHFECLFLHSLVCNDFKTVCLSNWLQRHP